MLRTEWPLCCEIANNNWWEKATPVSRSFIQSPEQHWMDCQRMHQIHVYMGDDQNHFSNNKTWDNTTIVTLNHNVVQNNGTDSQENSINNSNLNKRIWSEREIERFITIDTEGRLKGHGSMERLKKKWDEEFPEKTHITVRKACEIMQVDSRKKEKEVEIYKIYYK